MLRSGYSIAAHIAPANNAGGDAFFLSNSKTAAKTTTKTV